MSLTGIIKYLIIWQLVIVGITLASASILPLRETYLGGGTQGYLANPVLYSRANFDGVHYTRIAQNGYGYAQQAFFPLYPTVISAATKYFSSPEAAGVVVSLASFTIGAIFFVKLLQLDESPSVIRLTILALLFFPVSFYFSFVYTEGLFFMFLILAFYSARTRRWWLAGLFGGLAAYTRFVGIFLLPALLIEWWQQEPKSRRWFDLLPIVGISAGLLLYMRFLIDTTRDPLAFIHIQKAFGQGRGDKNILLYQVFWRYVKMIATVNRADPQYLTIILEAATGLLFLVTSIYSFVKTRLSYAVFTISAYLLPTLTGNFASLPRYALVCFPSFIIIGRFLAATHPINRKVLAISTLTLFFIFLSLFVRGYWVS